MHPDDVLLILKKGTARLQMDDGPGALVIFDHAVRSHRVWRSYTTCAV
ncbi:MAG: hypothetical protein IPG92_04315 [Flavobacteriales bacterium]|nr:hypothetical protein [Flavobacteriales bacterium]